MPWTVFPVCLAALVAALYCNHFLEPFEAPLRDVRFQARERLGLAPAVHPDLLLIAIDRSAYDRIRTPASLWFPMKLQVVSKLFQDRARAVGLGTLWELDPQGASKWPQLAADMEETERQLGVLALTRPLVMGAFLDPQEGVRNPSPRLVGALGQNRGLLNLHVDPGTVIRRYPLSVPVPHGSTLETFAFRLARVASVDSSVTSETARLNGLEIPLEEGAMWINYTGTRLPEMSFLHGLEPQPLSRVKGKVVLLGSTDPRSKDLFETPVGLRHGVEVHAQALNTLLTGQFLRSAPAWLDILAIMATASVTGVLALRCSPLPAAAGSAGFLTLTWALSVGAFVWSGMWLGMSGPLLVLLPTYVATVAYRYLVVDRERRQVRHLMRRHVSPQVMELLLSDPQRASLGGDKRRITILLSDINDFTPTCEQLSPERVLELLNQYFKEMTAIIFSHRGTIRQYVGDEIMVLYGAPVPDQEHALMAVQTALKMLERLEELRACGNGEGFVDIKVGIHTGEVVVGNVGSEDRAEYTAVGDNVNLTARIEGLNKALGTHLLISKSTRDAVEGQLPGYELVSVGVQTFKGRTQAMELFQVRRRHD